MMPSRTAAYTSPTKYNVGPNLSYEMAMGVPPPEPGLVFHFRKRYGDIDWRKLSIIDVDKVARELDFVTLQENISTVAFCNIDAVSDLDPLFTKLFKLSQYTIEYLLHSQEYLQSVVAELESKLECAGIEQATAQEKIQELNNEVQKLKAENKKRRKMIEQQQMLIESGASSYYKCPHCEKAFMNASFLQGHMQRKHPGSVNYIGDVIAHSQREQSRLAGKLQNLDEDLQQERINFTEKLKKAEEEKAAWGARTRRDMERWKKEEEGKWRRELESMKKSFVDEIQKLKTQETEYKNKITSLQQTMDERQSNLGELADDMEDEKQRLQVYADRIRTLEKTNADKQNQLKILASEMADLREQNKHALAKRQRAMAGTYDSQLQKIKDKIDRQSKVQRQKEIFPAAAPEAATTPEFSDETEMELEAIAAVRRDRKNVAKQMRPMLVQLMESKLEQCGINPRATGISTQILTNKLMVMKTERQRKAREIPGYFTTRAQMRRKVDEEVSARRGSPPRKRRGQSQGQLPTQRQRHSPVRVPKSLNRSDPAAVSRTPVPAGRKDHVPSPISRTDKTMTREELNTRDEEEESAWDSEMSELQSPAATRDTTQLAPSGGQQPTSPRAMTSTRIPSPAKDADPWDSDDLDDILSPDTERKTAPKGVKELGSKVAAQLQTRTVQKPPVGGFDISGQTSTSQIKQIYSDDEEFSPISSLDESPKPAPRTAQPQGSKVRLSTASSTNTQGTSVWGSNQGKPATEVKNGTADQESDWDDDISDL